MKKAGRRSSSMSVEEAALGALQVQMYEHDAGDRSSTRYAADTTRATSPLSPRVVQGPCSRATSRSSSRSRACSCRPHPGIVAATGLLATDLRARVRRDRAPPVEGARSERSYRPGVRRSLTAAGNSCAPRQGPTTFPRITLGLFGCLADCRYKPARATKLRFDVPMNRDVGDDLGRRSRSRASTRRTKHEYGHASFDAETSRSSTSVPLGIGRVD